MKAHPQSFDCWKSGQNPWKCGQHPRKSGQNPWKSEKIPKHLCKITEIQGKNGAQCLQKNKWRPYFWRSYQKLVGKSCTKTLWASFRKFGKKSFAPPNICLHLHLCLRVGILVKAHCGSVSGTQSWCATYRLTRNTKLFNMDAAAPSWGGVFRGTGDQAQRWILHNRGVGTPCSASQEG